MIETTVINAKWPMRDKVSPPDQIFLVSLTFETRRLSRVPREAQARLLCTLADYKPEQCADGPLSSMDNLVDFTRYSVIASRAHCGR